MKPRNFPERKNARRKAALARMRKDAENERERWALIAKIVTTARAVRTKKFGGKIARRAAYRRAA